MKQNHLSTIAWLLGLGIIVAGSSGWIMNIITIVNMESVFTGMGIVRIAGIFIAPIGAVLGYF